MKMVIAKRWDPDAGNFYLRQPDSDGRKVFDIRYTFNGIDFKGSLREQRPSARYAYRAEITAISPLTGKAIKDSGGNVVCSSFWANETDTEKLLDGIAKVIERMYADNAVLLSRSVEENIILRPEATTPSIAAERYAKRYEDSLSQKSEHTEKKYYRKAAVIKEHFAKLPQKPMGEIETIEIRRILPVWQLTAGQHKLLSGFWDWCIQRKYCTGCNPFPSLTRRTMTPEEKAKASETPEILDEIDIEKIFYTLEKDAEQTAKACATALQLWGGISIEKIRKMTWNEIVFDEKNPDKVILRLRDDERSGSTHRLDRPMFPMGARILCARYHKLTEEKSKSDLHKDKIVARKNGAAIPSGEIQRYVVKILKTIHISEKYYSRKDPSRIIAPSQLLEKTYAHMVYYMCGLGHAEPGTANYLCGRSLTGNVTDDNYTSFSSAEGLARLYAYMHRLCVLEPLPQNIPLRASASGDGEVGTFYPKTSRDRVTVTVTVLLQPGQKMTIEADHGGTGSIETEEATPTGRRRRKRD